NESSHTHRMLRRTASLIAALAAGAALVACSAKAPVSERVGAAVRQGGVVDLARLTDFPWEQAFVFSPFTTREQICQALSAQWADCRAAVPRVLEEGSYLLVFASHGKVVHQELHARANGDFCSTSCVIELTAAAAAFKAVADGKLPDGTPHYALY